MAIVYFILGDLLIGALGFIFGFALRDHLGDGTDAQ